MPTLLLSTKLYIPKPSFQPVTRLRLLQELELGIRSGCAFTLISAPAGYGKTTLVCEWASSTYLDAASSHNEQRRLAWLSLDPDDNELVRFWRYIVAALQMIEPDHQVYEEIDAWLDSPEPPPINLILTALLNKASERPPFVLVLDDYHVIASPALHESLAYWIDHAPASAHIILATRIDPPLPLGRDSKRERRFAWSQHGGSLPRV